MGLSTKKETNLAISFLLAVTSSAISAQLVGRIEEPFMSLQSVCVEGNCGEKIKVTEPFDVYVEVSCGVLRLQDFN
jgi:hypothetical protein